MKTTKVKHKNRVSDQLAKSFINAGVLLHQFYNVSPLKMTSVSDRVTFAESQDARSQESAEAAIFKPTLEQRHHQNCTITLASPRLCVPPNNHPATQPATPLLPRDSPEDSPARLSRASYNPLISTIATQPQPWLPLGGTHLEHRGLRQRLRVTNADDPPLLVGVPWTAATADPTPGTPPRPVVAEEPLVQTGSGPPQVAGGGMPGSQVVGGRWSRQRSGPGDTSRTLAVCCTEGSAPIVNPHLTVASFLRSASWL